MDKKELIKYVKRINDVIGVIKRSPDCCFLTFKRLNGITNELCTLEVEIKYIEKSN